HEALNTAAVWKLPVIFLIENNGYGLSTPSSQQFACEKLSDKAIGYGMKGVTIDGNNILEVHRTISAFAKKIRQNPEPVLIECNTFRMRGHEEASGTKYVPEALFEKWSLKDPLENYQTYLENEGLITPEKVAELKKEFLAEIDKNLEIAFAEPIPEATLAEELGDVYAPFIPEKKSPTLEYNVAPTAETKELRLIDACREALFLAMEKWPELTIMGQDVADYGGVFKVTEGFVDAFGTERVRNTTLCESAIIGIGLGLSLKSMKAVVEMQFADFVTCGFNQIVNNLAKIHYRWGQNADVVIRMPTGAGVGAGPFHSQSNEAWFFHTPGLKVVYPSNPHDAKGLMLSAIEDPNPVMVFEHKALYRSISAEVPTSYYTIPIGKAANISQGDDISIITYGMGVHWAKEAAQQFSNSSFDIVDLRSLLPWDEDAVLASVKRTGKVIILHEDTLTGGVGAEIASWISEHAFEWLDAPVVRVGALDTPVPFVSSLEKQFLPKERLFKAIDRLITY
ncbi:MAG: dehydrogenase, partial [Bacteroidetes bacterium]|nr:dehydrogenase [Bacteroidota bacterium]